MRKARRRKGGPLSRGAEEAGFNLGHLGPSLPSLSQTASSEGHFSGQEVPQMGIPRLLGAWL